MKRGSSLLIVSLILLVGVLVCGQGVAEAKIDPKNWLHGQDWDQLENPEHNPLGLEVVALTQAAGLPLVGAYAPEFESKLTLIYGANNQYLVVRFSPGTIIFNEDRDTLIEISGTVGELYAGKTDQRLHLNCLGLIVEMETNLTVDVLLQFANDLVDSINPQPGAGYLMNPVPGLDGTIPPNRTGTQLTLEEIREQAPFQVLVPELANWYLSNDTHLLSTRQSYQYSYFSDLTFNYSHEQREDLALTLTLGAEANPLYSTTELIESYTDQGVEFRHYAYPVRDGSTGELMQYEKVHWQAGDLHIELSINKPDQDLPTLAKACADQLGSIAVDEKKARTPRAPYKSFSIRGTYEEYGPSFTERAADFPMVGDYQRGTQVTFEDDGFESLTFHYEKGESRVSLTQHQRRSYYGKKSYTLDGVKVQEYSYETHITRDDGTEEITTYVMNWSVEGYYFELHGQDEQEMREFIKEVNTLVR